VIDTQPSIATPRRIAKEGWSGVVRAMSHQVLVMRDGVVAEQGAAAEIFERPRQAYTRALLAAALNLEATASTAVRT
jgi:microcin C transport system ATP-binding protein